MAHIRRLGELGGYNTNHFFRVDRGFVAQTADVLGGREAPLNSLQKVGPGAQAVCGALACPSSRQFVWRCALRLLINFS